MLIRALRKHQDPGLGEENGINLASNHRAAPGIQGTLIDVWKNAVRYP